MSLQLCQQINEPRYTHHAPPLLSMDPKGNSLGQINTHSRHTVGNGRRFEEREREESERESNRRVHVSSSRPLSCTCHERKTKDRPSDSQRFQAIRYRRANIRLPRLIIRPLFVYTRYWPTSRFRSVRGRRPASFPFR